MKLTKEMEIDLTRFTVSQHDRSNLRLELQKYWVGKPTSNIGLGMCRRDETTGCITFNNFGRTDILLVQFTGEGYGINCFIEPDGEQSIQPWDGVELDKNEKVVLQSRLHIIYCNQREFVEKQVKWRQWYNDNYQFMQLCTAETCVDYLKKHGW